MPKVVDHAQRREEISAIVAVLIAEGGMEAATIREIALRSGYSKGVIEHFFAGKDELISGALDWINSGYERRVENYAAGCSGLQALRKRIEVTLPINRAIRDEWKVRMVFWGMAAVQETLRVQQAERFSRAVQSYAIDISVAIERGDVVAGMDAVQLAQRLFTSTIGISTLALYRPALYDKAFLVDEIEHLMQRLTRGL